MSGEELENRIGRQEWVIMRYIADHHPIGVKEVADQMAEERGLARTSVQTVMEKLRSKGFLKRKRDGRRWVYFPRQEKQTLLKGFVKDFYENTLQGALSPFVAFLSEETDVSAGQLQELKKLVAKLEQKHGSEEQGSGE